MFPQDLPRAAGAVAGVVMEDGAVTVDGDAKADGDGDVDPIF